MGCKKRKQRIVFLKQVRGQGSAPTPPEVASPPLSEIADLSSTEAAKPHNPYAYFLHKF